ncbi:hypothetical protein [Actinomadura sp. K4S16]|uniref:hypothetical protein n=1 Tax=Actinomadura sp. K4S16 TaxID=1316147 RepID=UPI00135A8E4A|nr:hypothetical protein [Actinomadura sp. K4S16]
MDNPPGGPGKGPETTDKPTSPDTGGTSSHDHPGADGKTPRMDSLAAAGWKFPGRPEAGTGQPGDRDPKTNGSTADPTRDKPQAQGGSPAEAKPDVRKGPEADKTDSDPPSTELDDGETDPAQTGNGGPEAVKPGPVDSEDLREDEVDRGNDDQEAKTGQSETRNAGDQGNRDNKEAPPQDNGSSTGDKTDDPPPSQQLPSRLESLARAREAQHEYAEQQRAEPRGVQPSNEIGQKTLSGQDDQEASLQDEDTGGWELGPEVQPPATETQPGDEDDDTEGSGGGGSGGSNVDTYSGGDNDDNEDNADENGRPPEEETDATKQSGAPPDLGETYPVTEEQQRSFDQIKQRLDSLSKKKQLEEVGKGFERDGLKYKPEADLLGTTKHGIDWSEGMARAIKDGRPQGRFGSAADVQYATERGAELGPRKKRFFRLPEGHDCIEYHPDGTTSTPDSIFVKVRPNGKVHAYPLTR